MTEAMDLCRLCTNVANQRNAEKLFERNQRKLLRQIEEIMGQRLKKTKDLPQHICKPCEEKTLLAHEFRAECIRAQQYFVLQIKANNQQSKLKVMEITPIIEEVILNESNPVKEENEEKEDNACQVTEEVLLKHEPTISDDFNADDFSADNSDDSYNPLKEDHTNTTDDDDITREPEISLLVDEKPLLNKSKLKPHKKQKSTKKTKKEIIKQNSSTRKKSFVCELCGKQINHASSFKRHKLMHANIRPFQCDQCPSNFMLKKELKTHVRSHTGEKPYACSYCDRRYNHYNSKIVHERTHTKVRPYPCLICQKTFKKSTHLKIHMVVHSSERAFKCELCNVDFKRNMHLVTHYRSMTHKMNEEKQPTNEEEQPINHQQQQLSMNVNKTQEIE